jgi:hypothetical protein
MNGTQPQNGILPLSRETTNIKLASLCLAQVTQGKHEFKIRATLFYDCEFWFPTLMEEKILWVFQY